MLLSGLHGAVFDVFDVYDSRIRPCKTRLWAVGFPSARINTTEAQSFSRKYHPCNS